MPSTEGTHPSDQALEFYSLRGLSASEIADIEEHLLVCMECRQRLTQTEEYIAAMRQALTEVHRDSGPGLPRRTSLSSRLRSLPKPMWAGALVAAALAVVLVPIQRERMAPHKVRLATVRGESSSLSQVAPADSELLLVADITGLPSLPVWSAEVVDSQGSREFRETVTASQAALEIHLSKPLKTGQYWVRIYEPSDDGNDLGEPLREYSLRIE